MSDTPLLPTSLSIHTLGGHRQTWRFNKWSLIRLILPASILAAFLLFVFTAGVLSETGYRLPWIQPGPLPTSPFSSLLTEPL